MKTQIITLESHDDLISVRDRLSWAKTPRILLVWPKGEPVELRPLDLKVLKRHADALGAQLGVVTRGDAIRREAEAAGLPVFESSAAAQREAWPAIKRRSRRVRPPKRNLRELRSEAKPGEAHWRSNVLVRILAFALGVSAVLAIGAAFVPQAAITLYPESQNQELVFPVAANPSVTSVLLAGSVPAREEKAVVSGSLSMPVGSSQVTIGQTASRGVVRFSNLTQAQIEIPAGTIVYDPANPEIRFKTMNETVLAPGLDQFVEVPVEALEKGSQANVDAGRLLGIDGPVGLSAAATNPEATSGGSERTAIGPGQSQREQIREELMQQLMPQAMDAIEAGLSADEMLIEDSGQVAQVLEETYNPAQGEAGTQLELTARIEFAFRVVMRNDLMKLVEASLDAARPAGFTAVPGTTSFSAASKQQTDDAGVTRWQIRAERRLLRSMDTQSLLNMARGRSVKAAQAAVMAAFPWEKPPQFTMTPAWWPWIPIGPFSTTVSFQ
jgi:hypothetical protein